MSDERVLPDEAQLIIERRRQIADPPSEPPPALDDGPRKGLALSGGGIRSATFALGVLQAIAETPVATGLAADPRPGGRFRHSLLSRFDYLSTVSGGGFVGGFLCSLFQPGRLRPSADTALKAADDAVAVLASGPPGRIRSADSHADEARLRAPLAWLRENGRYLVPTGVGDAFYAAALGLRGWLSLHFVIGTILLALLTALALARQWLIAWQPGSIGWLETGLLSHALEGVDAGKSWSDAIWWSSLFALALAPLLLWALPAGVAFWLSFQGKHGRSAALNRAVAGMLAAIVVLLGLALFDPGGQRGVLMLHAPWIDRSLLGQLHARQWLWLGLAGLASLGVLYYIVVALLNPHGSEQSVELTRQLSTALLAVAALLVIACIETVGQTLYLLLAGGSPAPLLTPAALVAALVWLGRKGAALLNKGGGSGSKPAALQKLPLTTLGGLAGMAIFLLTAALWSVAVTALTWAGERPVLGDLGGADLRLYLGVLLLAALLIAIITGAFPAFINLSSLQGFYSARLTRAYLGASNGRRFDGSNPKALTVSEPLPDDNLWLDNFWSAKQAKQLKTLAPLHIVNVTLNKTVDPAEQLVQRDRKGQPMAVLPFGFAIDGQMSAFLSEQGGSSVNSPLSLGQWIGTSGAAFSTGIGRETSLGMSLLMGMANVRLGVWWGSGQGRRQITRWRPLPLLGAALGAVFRTQTYLSYEFLARFFGLRRQWQYLSDGGHFENTGIYELLRAPRRIDLILASDNGADPTYGFKDLANLIRLARIDLGVDIGVVRDLSAWPVLAGVFGTPEQFRSDTASTGVPKPCALLLRARRANAPPSWIVLLKPSLHADAPADVQQYGRENPSFPQESTTDQFFNEAQWESYRALGHHIARKILRSDVYAALQQYIERDGRPPGSDV
ncbi:patatin-like phospholipase family protein [Roseateles violae]|uniref:Patatin-like phospholipase family protein n=1 Tax=Roseateles violae TaxID=3058042 RepID=A0ABT8DKX0_9BURK|nr:patatin-like phospholipase family protein [Pelomonas sp. PFR6]MDN3919061.1 patatin-like phospholipase family protein [Pelomonas sp. PFR6]